MRELVGRAPRQALGERMRADPARERFEVFEAVASYLRLRARARTAPLLLVFDDLHMADGAAPRVVEGDREITAARISQRVRPRCPSVPPQ